MLLPIRKIEPAPRAGSILQVNNGWQYAIRADCLLTNFV